jgi:hypothetical protein
LDERIGDMASSENKFKGSGYTHTQTTSLKTALDGKRSVENKEYSRKRSSKKKKTSVYETMAAVECKTQRLSRHSKESTSLPGQGRVVGADDAILANKEGGNTEAGE